MDEYYNLIKPVLTNKEFLRRKNFPHHGDITVFDHCLAVSWLAFKLAKRFSGNVQDAAIGGLLHDFYPTPWQDKPKQNHFREAHGFVHAREAYQNVQKFFPEYTNDRIKDIIEKHMFPLNPALPRYRETWFVTLADKYVSLEIFKHPKNLHRYIGLGAKKVKKNNKKR